MTGGEKPGGTGSEHTFAESEAVSERLAKAMADLKALETNVAAAEEAMRQATITVRSKDRTVEVTVGHQGELIGLTFLEGKYRSMAAAELAASVLEAARTARIQMSRQVMDAMAPFTVPIPHIPEMKNISIDWERIFGPDAAAEPENTGRRNQDRRLDNEIDEDAEENNVDAF